MKNKKRSNFGNWVIVFLKKEPGKEGENSFEHSTKIGCPTQVHWTIRCNAHENIKQYYAK